jgi:DNA repair protein RadC
MEDGNKPKEHKGAGHRKRLREKFLNSGLAGFNDYEIVELLLTLGTPRRDCKQPAKDAIEKFNGLSGVFDASTDELQKVNGIGPSNVLGIKLFQAVSEIYSKEKIEPKTIFDSPKTIAKYLCEKIGKEKKEHFIVLFFDTRNNLIVNEVSVGTLNASLVHPREVFSQAIAKNASHVVVAHNHPSGDSTPSEEDIATTRRLIEAGKIIGISVVDHIVVSKNNYVSIREQGRI